MRTRKQEGQIIRIGDRWYVRYWERRNVSGTIERKRVTHQLGPVTTRSKRPPADIVNEAERHMATINSGTIPADRIVTISDFVDRVYLPWVELHKRPSTVKGYRDIWEDHLKPLCGEVWLKDARTFHVQGWLNQIAGSKLSRNTLKHIKSTVSGIFTLANSLEELQTIISLLPEPAATAFAVAGYMGLRHGEIQGLLWENYRGGEIFVSRSIWNGRVTDPKTRKGRAPIPVVRQLAERLEMHRLRCGNPQSGPIFANAAGKPLALTSVVNRVILPSLNRCNQCGKAELGHLNSEHKYERDAGIPNWHGWHAARRGLGSNLYRFGVSDMVIQRILRHANVSTTATYYIKTAADDVRSAMAKLESQLTVGSSDLSDTNGTLIERATPQPRALQ